MSSQLTQTEIAEAQIAFRETNERIQATADGLPVAGEIPFVCECPDADCSEIVRLTFDEYEAIRQHPRRFFNVPDHERNSVAAGAETVLVVFDRFTIVEKIGVAGELASDAHDAATGAG
jgi:hypothetical protein